MTNKTENNRKKLKNNKNFSTHGKFLLCRIIQKFGQKISRAKSYKSKFGEQRLW